MAGKKKAAAAKAAPAQAPAAPIVAVTEFRALRSELTFYEGGRFKRVHPAGTRVSSLDEECREWLSRNDTDAAPLTSMQPMPEAEAAALAEAIEAAALAVTDAEARSIEAAGAVVAATDADAMAAAAVHNDAMSTALQQCRRTLAKLIGEA